MGILNQQNLISLLAVDDLVDETSRKQHSKTTRTESLGIAIALMSDRIEHRRSFPPAAFTFLSIVINLPKAALDRYSTLRKFKSIFFTCSCSTRLKRCAGSGS